MNKNTISDVTGKTALMLRRQAYKSRHCDSDGFPCDMIDGKTDIKGGLQRSSFLPPRLHDAQYCHERRIAEEWIGTVGALGTVRMRDEVTGCDFSSPLKFEIEARGRGGTETA